jgi:hypothetical protein
MASADTPEIPESFLCPITCALMEDPVVDALGHTYERQTIEQVHCLHFLQAEFYVDPLRVVCMCDFCNVPHLCLRAPDCLLTFVVGSPLLLCSGSPVAIAPVL